MAHQKIRTDLFEIWTLPVAFSGLLLGEDDRAQKTFTPVPIKKQRLDSLFAARGASVSSLKLPVAHLVIALFFCNASLLCIEHQSSHTSHTVERPHTQKLTRFYVVRLEPTSTGEEGKSITMRKDYKMEFFTLNPKPSRVQVLIISIAAYVASLLGIVMMYVWYAPKLSCLLNICFITWTVVLIQLMTCVSLHSKVNGGLLTPGLMGLYIVFICWCAIRSEPPTETCSSKAEAAMKADWLTIISFIIALLAMAIATFATGIDSKSFQFKKEEAPSEENKDDVPYGYGFFHFVFSVGAMYFAMLLIGWNAHHTMQKWTIDVGWASTWVRIANEWLAACVYIWMLVAPLVLKNRRRAEST